MRHHTVHMGSRKQSRAALGVLLGTIGIAALAPHESLRAHHGPGSDTISIAHYNVQFLFPDWVPQFVLDAFGHFPATTERASAIGQQLACRDIISFNEVSNDPRRDDIFAALEANAAACGKPALVDGGSRFWNFFVGPDNSQTDPVLNDEIAIASRFPITHVHTLIYNDCAGVDCFADKGALHVRVWRGPGHHGRDAIDVFTTHMNDGEPSILLAQLDQLAAFIQAHHDPALPAIVMGDFNIPGNPDDLTNVDSLYNDMLEKLRGPLPELVDTGNPEDGTNEGATSRIDYLLVSDVDAQPTTVNYFTSVTPEGLSDHGSLLTTGAWNIRAYPPNPSVNLPKETRVEVSRLEEITADVPAVVPVPVPVIIPTPIGPVTLFFPVLVGCDGLTDHFGNLQLFAGNVAFSNFDEDHTFEGDDITPGWNAGVTTDAGVPSGLVTFDLFDDDDFFCGGGNDTQDINPFNGDFGIGLGLDFGADGIFFGSTRLATIGEPIFLAGTDADDRARATLFIETFYSSAHDSDGDGLIDADEAYTHGTDAEDPDTDDDGLNDGDEVNVHHTDPLNPDTDGDGLTDGDEVNVHHTDPLDADSDDDDLTDGEEINVYGTDPLDPDTDNDDLEDGEEVHVYHTDPLDPDTDDDELTDGEEVLIYHTDPLDPDTDDDELMDGLEVKVVGTDPLDPDTDDDGLKDGEDVEFIENVINGLAAASFGNPTHQATLVTRLEAIELQIAQGHRDEAITEIAKLMMRVDGCGSAADQNDWIINCTDQLLVRSLLQLLATNLAS